MSLWVTIQIQIISNSITDYLWFKVALAILKEAHSHSFYFFKSQWGPPSKVPVSINSYPILPF